MGIFGDRRKKTRVQMLYKILKSPDPTPITRME